MVYDDLQLAAGTSSGNISPPENPSGVIEKPPKYPLTTAGAAVELGISRRELFNTLARYAHVPGIVEKHGRKNLFYCENIERIRVLRRRDAAVNSRDAKNSTTTAVEDEYKLFVAGLHNKRKGGRHA